jgi:hypothetical protein
MAQSAPTRGKTTAANPILYLLSRQVSLSMVIATNGDVFPPLDSSPLRQPSVRPFRDAHDGLRRNASVLPVESRLCCYFGWYGIATRMTHTVETEPRAEHAAFGHNFLPVDQYSGRQPLLSSSY